MVFRYADIPHTRRHGPQGYQDYRSYKPWLRDEFDFRAAAALQMIHIELYVGLCYNSGRVSGTFQLRHAMSHKRRYITNEQGERIGVLLDLGEYHQLTRSSPPDPELLIGLTEAELQGLAESSLAPAEQSRLDALLIRNADAELSATEQAELDRLLHHVDQLTILKTRARYTLAHQAGLLQTS